MIKTETCPACGGAGTRPHEKRRLENGEIDPADFKVFDLCEPCGGSGVVPINQKPVALNASFSYTDRHGDSLKITKAGTIIQLR